MPDRPKSVFRSGAVPLHEIEKSLRQDPNTPNSIPELPVEDDDSSTTGPTPTLPDPIDEAAQREEDALI